MEGSLRRGRGGGGERESKRDAWGSFTSEITFPPGPTGQRQLLPKRYLNLHGLGNTHATPNFGGEP